MDIEKRFKRYDWKKLLELYRSSGLTTVEFCKHHGIRTGTFYKARRRVEVAKSPAKHQCDSKFVKVHAFASSVTYRVELPNGVKVSGADFDLGLLSRLGALSFNQGGGDVY